MLVPAGGADRLAGHEDPWAWDQPCGDRIAQGECGVAAGADVADRGEAGFQRPPGIHHAADRRIGIRLLEIGSAHLDGEIAAANDDPEAALAALRVAVERHQSLAYMEPPPWYAPPRLALGAALLAEGMADEAADVYRADLDQYPKNA